MRYEESLGEWVVSEGRDIGGKAPVCVGSLIFSQ